ncbi:hypothetical protein KCU77_g14396, partial [Aureobasidium melanogenum]
MAPATPFEKIKKAAGNRQRALGGGWSTPFPRNLAHQQSKVASARVIKSISESSTFFMKADDLLAHVEKQREEKLAEEKLAREKSAQSVRKGKGCSKATDLVTTAESSNKSKARHDSLSPLPAAPAKKSGFQRSSSGLSFESSSSSATTGVRGAHLLLAIIPQAHYDRWIVAWEELCNLTGDNIDLYYSSIEMLLEQS